jgi:hypothetical protein
MAVRPPSMQLYQLDPSKDERWGDFVQHHPKGSVFHSVGWLKALQLTYGYGPVVFTTSSPTEPLSDGLLFCQVESWLTGNRLVSLPFSDHCEPLFDTAERANFLVSALQTSMERMRCKYLEIRSAEANFDLPEEGIHLAPVASYFFHSLDLHPSLDELFQKVDKDSVQRRIHRAERAGLVEKSETSDDLLRDFYRLFALTRRRHKLPPTPLAWFRNLLQCQGKAVEMRLAYKDDAPVAAILTLRFKDVVYYKYGCSDPRFNKFGAMPWLLWHAIAAAKRNGAREFDLGRTEANNPGLLTFKNHWAPHTKPLVYWRLPENSPSLDQADGWKMRIAKRAFSHMPIGLLTLTGRLLYRHFG